MRKHLYSVIGAAPLATVAMVLSASITLVVAVTTVTSGRVSADAPFALIGALMFAAMATSETSRPRRQDRQHRRALAKARALNLIHAVDEHGATDRMQADIGRR